MRRSLDDQMQEKEAHKAEAYAEFLKEKILVDKVVQAIYDEDEAERRARHSKEVEVKVYIDKFIQEQEQCAQLDSNRIPTRFRRDSVEIPTRFQRDFSPPAARPVRAREQMGTAAPDWSQKAD